MKGKKYDQGKLRYDLLPVEIHEAIVKVISYGANKYCDNGWKDVEIHRYEAALMRHFNEWRKGEDLDEESGLPHLAHALTNIGFIYYLSRRKNE